MRRALVGQIVAWQLADVFLTWWLLSVTHASFEGNAVVSHLLGHGFDKLVVAKLLGVGVIVWLAYDMSKPREGASEAQMRRGRTACLAGLWLVWSFSLAVAVWDSIGVGLLWWYS